jgi:hypothetical protein
LRRFNALRERATSREVLEGSAVRLAVAALVAWAGWSGGAYALANRGSLAIAVWWAVALFVAVGVFPRGRLSRATGVVGGLLAAFALLAATSMLWAADDEEAYDDATRVALYEGVFALVVLATRAGTVRTWSEGLALGIVAVAAIALVSRLFPGTFSQSADLIRLFPEAERRLNYPVDYWNGLAALVALGLPLLLASAVSARTAAGRGLALAPLPALAGTIYLTSSRGGTLAALAAVVLFVALVGTRWRALAALALAGAGSAVTVALLAVRSDLVNRPLAAVEAARDQGRSAAVLLALCCIAVGVAWAAVSRLQVRVPRLPLAARAGLAAGLVALFAVGTVAGHPVERFENFKRTPETFSGTSVGEHFLSTSGNNRWPLWTGAAEAFQERPLIGHGSGSFAAWWARHKDVTFFVRDAHSLYLETLAELGVVGLALLLCSFALGIETGLRRLTAEPEQRAWVAALTAAVVAFAFQTGIDWLWELPVVSLVAVACLGLLTGPATLPAGTAGVRHRWRLSARAGAAVVALLVAAAAAIPVLADSKLRSSRREFGRGDVAAAITDARDARAIEPWASTPDLQLALLYEASGDLAAAERAVVAAIDENDSDWRSWLTRARIETKAGRFAEARTSLRRAVELNPRSPLWNSAATG